MSQITLGPFANFNSAVPWGLWVSIYIWLVGISAGSFFLVMWGNLNNNPHLKHITRLGILLALSALSVGLLSILIDLGHMEWFYKLFISPSPIAVMAWVVWLYNVYFVLLAFSIYRLKKGFARPFLIFSVLFALAIIVIESLLFARPPGKYWHSPIFMVHFLSSSLVSAIAALIFLAAIFGSKDKREDLLRGLTKIAIPLILVNFLIESLDIILLGNAAHLKEWLLPLGNIIAIALLLRNRAATIAIAGCVGLVDVLLSKYNSLISAQVIEPFKGFSSAYIESKLQFSYAPTTFEILVSVLLACMAASIFYFLYKIFPLTREE